MRRHNDLDALELVTAASMLVLHRCCSVESWHERRRLYRRQWARRRRRLIGQLRAWLRQQAVIAPSNSRRHMRLLRECPRQRSSDLVKPSRGRRSFKITDLAFRILEAIPSKTKDDFARTSGTR